MAHSPQTERQEYREFREQLESFEYLPDYKVWNINTSPCAQSIIFPLLSFFFFLSFVFLAQLDREDVDWSEVAEHVDGRSALDCRIQWLHHDLPAQPLTHGVDEWLPQEDREIAAHVAAQKQQQQPVNWRDLAARLHLLTGIKVFLITKK